MRNIGNRITNVIPEKKVITARLNSGYLKRNRIREIEVPRFISVSIAIKMYFHTHVIERVCAIKWLRNCKRGILLQQNPILTLVT